MSIEDLYVGNVVAKITYTDIEFYKVIGIDKKENIVYLENKYSPGFIVKVPFERFEEMNYVVNYKSGKELLGRQLGLLHLLVNRIEMLYAQCEQ